MGTAVEVGAATAAAAGVAEDEAAGAACWVGLEAQPQAKMLVITAATAVRHVGLTGDICSCSLDEIQRTVE
jgi:hypothetical protein